MECRASLAPCSLCEFAEAIGGEGPFKLFDFSDEAASVLESMKKLRRVGVNYIAQLYRGQLPKRKSV